MSFTLLCLLGPPGGFQVATTGKTKFTIGKVFPIDRAVQEITNDIHLGDDCGGQFCGSVEPERFARGGVQCRRGACGHGVWRITLTLADCETASSVFAFLRLAAATFATSSDVRVEEKFPEETGDLPMVETIVADSGIFQILRDEKVQKLPARLISSELRAHQMSPSGVTPHWRSRPALELMDGISL